MTDKGIVKEIEHKYILHWNFRGFHSLPEELKLHGQHLEEIYLKWNNIVSLPSWIQEMKFLTNLYMFANKLVSLPDEIGSVPNLRVLDLDTNQLETLPKTLKNLKNLKILNLRYNCLQEVPEEISSLKSLSVLNLQGNKLKEVPTSMCNLHNLTELILDLNFLTRLPLNIVYLPNLTILSVMHNHLIYLPSIWFQSNPIVKLAYNSTLNYLSYDFGFGLTLKGDFDIGGGFWNVHFSGCCNGIINEELNCKKKYVYVTERGCYLLLPEQVRTVMREGGRLVPSLLEFSLRICYRILFQESVNVRSCTSPRSLQQLPLEVRNILSFGPTAFCHQCRGPVFTEVLLCVVQRYNLMVAEEQVKCIIATIYFCSTNCNREFTREEMMQEEMMDNLYLQQLNWEWK